jgi:hypothetical protein
VSASARPALSYRARSATEIIDASIQLLRQHYSQFLTINAAYYVPVLIVQWVWQQRFTHMVAGTIPTLGDYSSFFYLMPVFYAWYAIFNGAMTAAASEAYLGRALVPSALIARGLASAVRVFIIFIIKSLFIGVAFIIFFFPAIFASLITFATMQAAVIERRGIMESFARSSDLSKGNKKQIFGAYTIVVLIGIVVYMMFAAIGVFVGAALHAPALALFFAGLGSLLVYPLFPIVGTVLYYDARIRNEGFDLELLAVQTGGGGAAPVPAAS